MIRMSHRAGAPTLALFLLGGCHVVERSNKCQQIAAAFSDHQQELAQPLVSDPTPESVAKKARLYEEIGNQLKSIPIDKGDLRKQRGSLVKKLNEVTAHLDKAAQAAAEAQSERQAAEEAEERFSEAQAARKRTQVDAAEQVKEKGEPPSERPRQRIVNDTHVHRARERKAEREYMKAKVAIEGFNREIASIMRQLQNLCH